MAASILTVDDSASMRQMLGFILKSAGYEVVQAANGEEAMTYASEREFDMILTDQNMPGSDGISLVRSLRTLPAYGRTPIIMLTTESEEKKKLEGQAAGAKAWVVKPFQPAQMLGAVAKLVLP